MEPHPRQRPGRPRDPTVAGRVLTAVVEELTDAGVSGFSINSVSTRCGVSKRSIGSRWPDKQALILDGVSTLGAGLVPPHTNSLIEDLHRMARDILAVMAEPRRSILARCAAEVQSHPIYYQAFRRESVDRCMAAVQDVLFDARHRGEVRDDIDLSRAADCFVTGILGSAAFAPANSPDVDLEQLADVHVDIYARGVASVPQPRESHSAKVSMR